MSKEEILKRFGNREYVTAEDLYLSIRSDGTMYEACLDAARKPTPRQQRRAFDAIIRKGWKNYKRNVNPLALVEANSLPRAGDMLWTDIVAHYKEFYAHEMPVIEAHYIIDDVITERGREGFVLMWGNPYTGIGLERAKSITLKGLEAMIPEGETIYRVKLARRYADHMVTILNRNRANRWDDK